METYYIIYQVTNKINGKIYIGAHKTSDLNDNYMGSGKHLKNSQRKYGIDNFVKEILFIFDTPYQMYAKEAELVNLEFIQSGNTYNLKMGGSGGWDYVNSSTYENPTHTKEHLKTIERIRQKKYPNGTRKGFISNDETKKKISQSLISRNHKGFLGKKHSDETKELMSAIAKDSKRSQGSNNSQYGTMWIHSKTEQCNMKIKNGDPIPCGWELGRKIKF